MEFLYQRLGPCTTVRDLVELGVEGTPKYKKTNHRVPKYSPYWTKNQKTPDWRDQYVNAEILLPRKDRMARDQMVHLK